MSKSVGQASYELLQKPPERINVIDMQREMQKTVQRMLDDIISKHKDYAKKYYIVYMLQRDRMMENTIRQRFIVRRSRPLPDYDCTLFSYDNGSSELRWHWTIPDEATCEYFIHNKGEIPAEQKELLFFIESFADEKLA